MRLIRNLLKLYNSGLIYSYIISMHLMLRNKIRVVSKLELLWLSRLVTWVEGKVVRF
jgi:hypothetical protein